MKSKNQNVCIEAFLRSYIVVFNKKVKCIEQTEDDRHFSS